ncbi:hypothetical protein ASPNIDRAFT_41225 [Aspergillus niger ATCC 1015]|uniref:Uncharacterized protein n=1 Tax=Aspergillus niger (strain ATCC 1015 / CBS 113.46 / FGSC A1144 / LSHB Ac4 / NCTC 3858a / NRRL 328 / USDA 3528.7) TaxID=380704 RepID=G3Y5I7_ASPNA|nr:hypothetical protein ASPNIDRAFT_41225 [Aspergillus niger ATCC 1015]
MSGYAKAVRSGSGADGQETHDAAWPWYLDKLPPRHFSGMRRHRSAQVDLAATVACGTEISSRCEEQPVQTCLPCPIIPLALKTPVVPPWGCRLVAGCEASPAAPVHRGIAGGSVAEAAKPPRRYLVPAVLSLGRLCFPSALKTPVVPPWGCRLVAGCEASPAAPGRRGIAGGSVAEVRCRLRSLPDATWSPRFSVLVVCLSHLPPSPLWFPPWGCRLVAGCEASPAAPGHRGIAGGSVAEVRCRLRSLPDATWSPRSSVFHFFSDEQVPLRGAED